MGSTGDVNTEGPIGVAFDLGLAEDYLRVRISYTRVHPDGGYERFFAWTQPVFLDGR